jgi:hypothetical protein
MYILEYVYKIYGSEWLDQRDQYLIGDLGFLLCEAKPWIIFPGK